MCWGRQGIGGGGVQKDKGTSNMPCRQSVFPERETSVSLNLETMLSFQQVINQPALYIFFSILNSVNWQFNLKSLVFSPCSAVNRDWQFIFKHPGWKKKNPTQTHTPQPTSIWNKYLWVHDRLQTCSRCSAAISRSCHTPWSVFYKHKHCWFLIKCKTSAALS